MKMVNIHQESSLSTSRFFLLVFLSFLLFIFISNTCMWDVSGIAIAANLRWMNRVNTFVFALNESCSWMCTCTVYFVSTNHPNDCRPIDKCLRILDILINSILSSFQWHMRLGTCVQEISYMRVKRYILDRLTKVYIHTCVYHLIFSLHLTFKEKFSRHTL